MAELRASLSRRACGGVDREPGAVSGERRDSSDPREGGCPACLAPEGIEHEPWCPATFRLPSIPPAAGAQVRREALVAAATRAIREAHGPSPEDRCCTFPDVYGARATDAILAALAPLLGNPGEAP